MKVNRFLSDVTAGLTVSFAAISLGAAFGIMSGRGAFAGMIGAAVIPIVASTFGGTRWQASGPTAPMTAVSALVIAFAYDKFPEKALAEQFITLIFLLSAILIGLAGVLRAGNLIKLVPNVIILGFTLFTDLNIAVVTGSLLFYIAKHFWKIQDVEDDLTEVSAAERQLISN